MSSIIAAVFKATIGLLVAKGRNLAAQKLKEGDITDEQFRNFIVREIDDIKSKLDGLARTNLLASISFFKEGLVYLYKVLDLETIEGEAKITVRKKEQEKNPDTASASLRSPQAASVKTVSLAEEMKSLQVPEQDVSTRRALKDAKNRFKQARQKATEAFCNEALSTSDRILAMQYRLMATLLEKVDNPDEALAACRLCLEELHSLPAVQKSFNVQLSQGFKSWFNTAEREDLIRSVCRVNRVMFHVTQMVGGDVNLSLWPCVDSGEEKVDPSRDTRVTELLRGEGMEHCILKLWVEGEGEKDVCHITTNTQGQFIIAGKRVSGAPYLEVFDCTGKHLHSHRLPLWANNIDGRVWSEADYKCYLKWFINDIDTDRDNNIFILVCWNAGSQNDLWSRWSTSLHAGYWSTTMTTVQMFDEHATLQRVFNLKDQSIGFLITVNDNNKVFVAVRRSDVQEVQVYDTNGLLLNSFRLGTLKNVRGIAATNSVDGRIMVLEDRRYELWIHSFSEQGHHRSEFKCANSKPSDVSCIASHHASEHVFVLLQETHPSKYIYPRMLYIFTKDGKFVRSIHLSIESLMNRYQSVFSAIVTKEGLVAMPARHRCDMIPKKVTVVVL